MSNYRSRKEQIDTECYGNIVKTLEKAGIVLTRGQKKAIRQQLKFAAMIGAAEQRYRVSRIARQHPSYTSYDVWDAITSQSEFEILGYVS